MNITDFQDLLQQKGHALYRDMPWRDDTRPYYVLVSELMLQQTQVDRVIPKFLDFIAVFPNEKVLAKADLAEVLILWQGLGYNRRAKYLHDSAKMIVNQLGGTFPQSVEELLLLPGVGPGTAGAIAAYSYNQPVVFIETNIRTVYIHHFFGNSERVDDTQLTYLVEATLDFKNPRRFYQSLMDYGTWLKRQGLGKLSQSKHYKKQAPLRGSIREMRGQIIALLSRGEEEIASLDLHLGSDDRFVPALEGLMNDGLVSKTDKYLHLTK